MLKILNTGSLASKLKSDDRLGMGGGVLQERAIGDYRWTDRPGLDSTIQCDILTCIALASLYMITNVVLRTFVSLQKTV